MSEHDTVKQVPTTDHSNESDFDAGSDSGVGASSKSVSQSISEASSNTAPTQKEYGGRREGLEPTRYGDWEKNGRCIDF